MTNFSVILVRTSKILVKGKQVKIPCWLFLLCLILFDLFGLVSHILFSFTSTMVVEKESRVVDIAIFDFKWTTITPLKSLI